MRQSFGLPTAAGVQLILDLGRVRGTVEARLNDHDLSIRCLCPYRFDLTNHATTGINTLELLITNRLANHLSTWSPTRWWSPDQLDAGVFGPVSHHLHAVRLIVIILR